MSKPGETRLADRFARGDVLVLRADSNSPAWGSATEPFVPRECCVVEAGEEWLTIGVGISWPVGLWEARRRPGSFGVALERAAPQAPLKAQREALELTRKGTAGEAAALLASGEASLLGAATAPPPRFAHGASAQTADVPHGGSRRQSLEVAIQDAIAAATAAAAATAEATAATEGRRRRRRHFVPNQSQVAAPCALYLLLTTYYLLLTAVSLIMCSLFLAPHYSLLTTY